MTKRSVEVVSPTFGLLRSTLRGSKDALLCTAFFSKEGIVEAEKALSTAEKIEFWLPLNVTHWVSGHADFDALAGALQRLSKRRVEVAVRVRSTVHAKLYYGRDKRAAIVTSANLTKAGFGGNVEIAAVLQGAFCDSVDQWIARTRRRIQEILLDDLVACIELTRDDVMQAASELQEGDGSGSPDFHAAVDLFENELVKRIAPPRPGRGKVAGKRTGTLPQGAVLSPALTGIAKRLPSGWPSYAGFVGYLRSLRNPEATELAERADGKANLSGHVKHFFWSSLLFLLENPAIIDEIDLSLAEEKIVYWDELPWVSKWREFLERHDDEYYPELEISFHTVKVYLPPTLGGATTTGGAGSGNFKRTIAFLARYLREAK